MLRLTEKYGHLPVGELPLLFHRIVQNAIRDWFRRQKVRSTWTTLLSALAPGRGEEDDQDPLDTLQEAAVDGEGVFGARLTGAGFGGCILALTRRGAEGAVITRVVERYRRRFGMEPTIHRLAPAGGLHEEDEEVAG